VFCRKIVIAVIALSIGISILGDAKSLYVIARHHTAQFDAWNIEAPGCPTPIKYQASYALSHASDPAGVAIDNDSAVLFITSEFDEGVELVDATNMEPLGWAPGAKNLAGIDIDDRNNIVYAVQRGTGNLYVYAWDPTARTLTLKEGFPKPLPDCGAAFGLALDEIRGLLYVADNQSGLVRIYDTATLTEVSNFAPSIPPVGIAVDRRRQLVYVTAPDASCGPTLPSYTLLCKYDLATEVETTVDMGHGGMGIAVDEVTGYVYVTGGCNGDDISVWDSNLNFVYSTGPIGGSEEDGGPAGIAIGNVSYNPLKLVKNDTVVGYGVYIGQQFTYSITFGNSGDSDITGVQVIDTLPLELDFVAETLDGAPGTGVYDPVTHTVTWDVGTLTPGSTGQIELVVRVNQNAAGKTIIYNYCTIESDQTPPTTVIGEDPDNPSPGEPGTYIIVNQPPDTKIETADIDPVKGTATFTWSGTDDTTPPENLVYSYRLAKDSVYNDWSPWSSATTVTYTDLEPGNYRFQVRAKDADGAIDPAPATRKFTVNEEPLNCVVHLRPHGVEASIGVIGDFETFDIYVGESTGVIKRVRFSSDKILDGVPTGEWTPWFDWNVDAYFPHWDSLRKTVEWSFTTGGEKEVWAEIEDSQGVRDRDCAYIMVQVPLWRRDLRIGDILYDPCTLMITHVDLAPKIFGCDRYLGHVGIYIGNGWTADPQPDSCKHPITTWDQRENVEILRVYRSGTWAEEEARAAAAWARTIAEHDEYTYQLWPEKNLLKYGFGKNADQDETVWYCSELVWAAYFNQGIDIEAFPGNIPTGKYYNPFLPVSPNEICEDGDVYPVGGHTNGVPVVVLKGRCDCSEHGSIKATCPVDVIITDPDGLTVSKEANEIANAVYWADDFDADGSLDVLVEFGLKEGRYEIQVQPRPEAEPTDTYTLVFKDHRTGEEIILADKTLIKNIPGEPYEIEISAGGAALANAFPQVSILTPIGGETITATICQIQWQAADPDDADSSLSIDLFYSSDSGTTWTSIATNEANDGLYNWDISTLHNGEYWLKVVARDPEGAASEEIVGPFTIVSLADYVIVASNPVGDEGAVFLYTLPESTATAKLLIFDAAGRLLFETPLDVSARRFPSAGTWNPVDQNGAPLANGPYIYVLVADGKVIGQGKMVIQR